MVGSGIELRRAHAVVGMALRIARAHDTTAEQPPFEVGTVLTSSGPNVTVGLRGSEDAAWLKAP